MRAWNSKTDGYSLANGQQTFLYGIPLCFGEGPPLGEPVNGLQRGINQGGAVLRPGKQWGAPRKQREHRRAYIPVERQCSLCGAEGHLGEGIMRFINLSESGQTAPCLNSQAGAREA